VRDVPPLPPALHADAHGHRVGTVLWLAAAGVVLVTGPPLLLATCLVGAGLGGVGWAIFAWQRAAARRGSRTAQSGLEP
jgi:hypothetical protein